MSLMAYCHNNQNSQSCQTFKKLNKMCQNSCQFHCDYDFQVCSRISTVLRNWGKMSFSIEEQLFWYYYWASWKKNIDWQSFMFRIKLDFMKMSWSIWQTVVNISLAKYINFTNNSTKSICWNMSKCWECVDQELWSLKSPHSHSKTKRISKSNLEEDNDSFSEW